MVRRACIFRRVAICSAARSPVLRIFVWSLLALFPQVPVSHAAGATDRATQTLLKDGIIHVINGAEPLEPPVTLKMEELWRLESETRDARLVFGAIEDVERSPTGDFYLLDYVLKTVHAISTKGEYICSIGRDGDGPGEFRSVNDCFLTSDGQVGVVEYNSQRIQYLTKDGTSLGRWSPAGFGELRVRPLFASQVDSELVVCCRLLEPLGDRAILHAFLGRFGQNGNLLGKFFERTATLTRGEPYIFDEEASESIRFYTADKEGRVFVSPFYSQYCIHCYGRDGVLRKVITREYEHFPRPPQEVERMSEILLGQTRAQGWKSAEVAASKYERDIYGLGITSTGDLVVETSRGCLANPAGIAIRYDVFDMGGNYVRQVVLRGEADPWEDFFFYFEDCLVRVTEGYDTAKAQSAPTGKGAAGTTSTVDNTQKVICYRLSPAS